MIQQRWSYYIVSGVLTVLSITFCITVYISGQFENLQLGSFYLIGIPNYYFFYTFLMPFITAGVMYIALQHRKIRFFGKLSDVLDDNHRIKILYFRKIFLVVAIIFSTLIAVNDTLEKNHTLPPYSYTFETNQIKENVAFFYSCKKKWVNCNHESNKSYLEILNNNKILVESTTGFDSLSHWYTESSWIYKFEFFLSFLASFIMSLFTAEILLLLMSKNFILAATKNLVIWLITMTTFWFPTKLYSFKYYNFNEIATPSIFIFGLLILMIGVLLIFFLNTEKNELYKYASVVACIISFVIASLSWFKPDFYDLLLKSVISIGWLYGLIFLSLLFFSLYLVTDYFISNYEQENIIYG